MKFLVTILLIGLTSAYVEGSALIEEFKPCPEICPALYAPLCATNGDGYKEFGNDCILQSANCRLRQTDLKTFVKTDMDWCTTQYIDNLNALPGDLDLYRPECVKPCTMMYSPLCVSNGQYRTTASSECVLEMYNCAIASSGSKLTFRVLKQGVC